MVNKGGFDQVTSRWREVRAFPFLAFLHSLEDDMMPFHLAPLLSLLFTLTHTHTHSYFVICNICSCNTHLGTKRKGRGGKVALGFLSWFLLCRDGRMMQ